MGEEPVRCHAEVRHKLDQQNVPTGDEGPGRKSWRVKRSLIKFPLKAEIYHVSYFGA